jgi:hypothetical protein
MRVLMSLAGLLLVLLLVSKLAGTQLQALGPGASASAATGTALQEPANHPSNAASAAAARVMQAMEQGAAQRAEDAASR